MSPRSIAQYRARQERAQRETMPTLEAVDPSVVKVLSSDGVTRYKVRDVNGALVCDCQAGQHGVPCRHTKLVRDHREQAAQRAAKTSDWAAHGNPENASSTRHLPRASSPSSAGPFGVAPTGWRSEPRELSTRGGNLCCASCARELPPPGTWLQRWDLAVTCSVPCAKRLDAPKPRRVLTLGEDLAVRFARSRR